MVVATQFFMLFCVCVCFQECVFMASIPMLTYMVDTTKRWMHSEPLVTDLSEGVAGFLSRLEVLDTLTMMKTEATPKKIEKNCL